MRCKLRFPFLRRFRSEQSGNIAVEAAILLPIMIWGYLAMFTIFDTYRQYTTQQKAAYTVSDLISRQATPLDADFIDGSHELFRSLTRSLTEPGLRVTIAKYDLVLEEYRVIWSRTRGGMVALTSQDIANWSNRLPVLPQDDQIIIVETSSLYPPAFDIGLGLRTINNFVFTRPRYASQVCLNTGGEEICDLPNTVVPEPSEEESA
jgi:hypothetical protein